MIYNFLFLLGAMQCRTLFAQLRTLFTQFETLFVSFNSFMKVFLCFFLLVFFLTFRKEVQYILVYIYVYISSNVWVVRGTQFLFYFKHFSKHTNKDNQASSMTFEAWSQSIKSQFRCCLHMNLYRIIPEGTWFLSFQSENILKICKEST